MIFMLFQFILTVDLLIPSHAWTQPNLRHSKQTWTGDTQNGAGNDPIVKLAIKSLSKHSLASLLSLQLFLPLNQPKASASYLSIDYKDKQVYVQLTEENNRFLLSDAPEHSIRFSQVKPLSRPPAVDQLINAVNKAIDLIKQSSLALPVLGSSRFSIPLPNIDTGIRIEFRNKNFFVNFAKPEFPQPDQFSNPASSRLLTTTVRLESYPTSNSVSSSKPLFSWAILSGQLSELANPDRLIEGSRVAQDFAVSMLPLATDWRVLAPALLLLILLADARQGQAQFRAALAELQEQLEAERNLLSVTPVAVSDESYKSDHLSQQLAQMVKAEKKIIDKLDEKQEQLLELEGLYEMLLQEKAVLADKRAEEMSTQIKTYSERLEIQTQLSHAEQEALRNQYSSLLQDKEHELAEIKTQLESLLNQQKLQSLVQTEMESQLLSTVRSNEKLTEQVQLVTQQWEARLKSVEVEKEQLVNSRSTQLRDIELQLTSKFNAMLADRDSKQTEFERVWRSAVEAKEAQSQSQIIAMQADSDKLLSELEARWRANVETLEQRLEAQEKGWREVVLNLESKIAASAESVSLRREHSKEASSPRESQPLEPNIVQQAQLESRTQMLLTPPTTVRSKNALNEEMVLQALMSAKEEISDEDYDEYIPSDTSVVDADFDLGLSPDEMQALAAEVESILATEEAAMEFAEAKRWDSFSTAPESEIKSSGTYEWSAELKQAILAQAQIDAETAPTTSENTMAPLPKRKAGRKSSTNTPSVAGEVGAGGDTVGRARKPKAKTQGGRKETKESPDERLVALKALSPDELRRRKKKDLLEDVRLLDMWPDERETLSEYGRDTLLATVELYLQEHP